MVVEVLVVKLRRPWSSAGRISACCSCARHWCCCAPAADWTPCVVTSLPCAPRASDRALPGCIVLRGIPFLFCVSSVLRKTTVPYKGACFVSSVTVTAISGFVCTSRSAACEDLLRDQRERLAWPTASSYLRAPAARPRSVGGHHRGGSLPRSGNGRTGHCREKEE